MSEVIEGRNAVLEALRSGAAVTEVLLYRGNGPHPVLDEIAALANSAGVRVRQAERADLDSLSARGAHQGVVATTSGFAYVELDAFLSTVAQEAHSLVLVLDHVTDPGNLGAAIRSAEALGADCVVIPKARAAAIGPVVWKTSAGALAHLPVVRVANIARAIETLKGSGYWVLGASEAGRTDIRDATLDDRQALVLGAEGEGLSSLVERSCDELVRITLPGKTDSLNVAQAATVLVWEWTRRKGR